MSYEEIMAWNVAAWIVVSVVAVGFINRLEREVLELKIENFALKRRIGR